jgi:tetratricopeptide (TPR) repeat protein
MKQLLLFLFGMSFFFQSCNDKKSTNTGLSKKLVDSAEVLMHHNKWEKADILFSEAIAANNNNAVALNDMAVCKFHENKPVDTIEFFIAKAKKADPDYIVPWFNLAHIYQEMKLYNLAVIEAGECISRIDKDDDGTKRILADAHVISGNSYLRLKKYDSALVHLAKAIQLDDNNNNAYVDLSSCLFQLGEYDKSILVATTLINKGTNYYQIFNERGICYTHIGKYNLALRDLDIAIDKEPGNGLFYGNRYVLFVKMKMMDKAMRDYKMADSLGDEDTKELIREKVE